MRDHEVIGDGLVTVRVFRDDDAISPRVFDNAARLLCWHRRYALGDGTPDPVHLDALDRGGFPLLERYLRLCEGAVAVRPLGLFDHSGISMYVGGGSHGCDPGGWDSGTVGYAYVTRERADELGVTDPDAAIVGEVEEYDRYLTGDVYGLVAVDETGDELDSCWGFIGHDYAVSVAREWITALTPDAERAARSRAHCRFEPSTLVAS